MHGDPDQAAAGLTVDLGTGQFLPRPPHLLLALLALVNVARRGKLRAGRSMG